MIIIITIILLLVVRNRTGSNRNILDVCERQNKVYFLFSSIECECLQKYHRKRVCVSIEVTVTDNACKTETTGCEGKISFYLCNAIPNRTKIGDCTIRDYFVVSSVAKAHVDTLSFTARRQSDGIDFGLLTEIRARAVDFSIQFATQVETRMCDAPQQLCHMNCMR